MSDVTLSAAVRSSLLSLQNTTNLIDRTQNRLSSGLKVAGAIDDPVAFFQAKTLTDRAFDFTEKKDGIDQGVSTVSAALEGIQAIEDIVRQLKGISNSLKSATGTQFADLVTQFNTVRTNIGTLADDSSYQGTNLVNNTTETLSVSFSEKTGSLLSVQAVNVRESGLGIAQAIHGSGVNVSLFNFSAATNPVGDGVLTAGDTILVTYYGTARAFTTTGGGAVSFTYGTVSISVRANTQTTINLSAGDVITLTLSSAVGSAALFSGAGTGGGGAVPTSTSFYGVVTFNGALTIGGALGGTGFALSDVSANVDNIVVEGVAAGVDATIDRLDSALATLRSNAQTLGSNVALLQTRLDFTETYVNTLEVGASKLTLADINEEGANLLALQTRQQLGISALAFAGQAEQGILSLFR